MFEWIHAIPVSRKIAIIPTMFIASILGILAYTVTTLDKQQGDSVAINLAGRQRMLNQRLAKEVMLTCQGQEADIQQTIGLLKDTVGALRDGGEVSVGQDETTTLARAESPEIAAKLDEQRESLGEVEILVEEILSLKAKVDGEVALLPDLEQRVGRIHELADQAVGAFSSEAAEGGDYTAQINLAGRQRMLNQRLMKEILAAAGGQAADWAATRGLVSSTLDALLEGGTASLGKDKTVQLPPAPASVRDLLLDQRRELDEFFVAAEEFLLIVDDREQLARSNADLTTLTATLHKHANAAVDMLAASAQAKVKSMTSNEIAIGIGAVLLGAILSWLIVRSIVGPVNDTIEAMTGLDDGNLTRRLEDYGRGDMGDLARSVNGFLIQLESSMRGVRTISKHIDQGASQMNGSSQDIASAASEQAASIEEVSAALEEVSAMAEQNSDNAQEANSLSSNAEDAASNGAREMDQMSTAMEEIKESSSKVSKIIKVIDEIAFQTNLLALNAAVEAARAGEAGKGFAVVAEEVRSLAQRSAEAAKTTADLIEEANLRADNGVAISGRVGASLTEIVTRSTEVTALLGKISSASAEQNLGIEQITTSMTDLGSVTQSNAASAEELAATADEAARQVLALRKMISHFTVSSEVATAHDTARSAQTPPSAGKVHNSHAPGTSQPAPIIPLSTPDEFQDTEEFSALSADGQEFESF
jgi:methyl-accepting chemotaxis protein